MIVDYGTACATLAGQTSSGDRPIVVELAGGVVVGAVDGLGHGHDACLAAEAAVRTIEEAPGLAVDELFARCHQRLRVTRGAVMTLARVSTDGSMTWLGVGNVDAVLVRASAGAGPRDEGIALRGGIVGYRMPPLRPRTLALQPGDSLVFATDGVRNGFRSAVVPDQPAQQLAQAVLEGYRKGNDDACVVVARFLGAA
jgi:hypothetical protein